MEKVWVDQPWEGVICGLQRLWYTFWQTAYANSPESTRFQHKAVGFIMVVKILPLALLVKLCNVRCTVLSLCSSAESRGSIGSVSASTFAKVQVRNLWERRKKKKTTNNSLSRLFLLKTQTSLLFCHDQGDSTFSRGKLGCRDFLGEPCMKTRLVIILQDLWHWRGLNLQLTTLSVHYLTGWPSWTNTELFCFSLHVGESFLSKVSGKKKEKSVFFPSAAPSPKRIPLQG